MALQVTIYALRNFEDKVIGSITLDENGLHVEPPNDPMMQRMMKTPVGDETTRRFITPEKNPRQWMHALKSWYNSAYLRASAPIEINRPPTTPPAASVPPAALSPAPPVSGRPANA